MFTEAADNDQVYVDGTAEVTIDGDSTTSNVFGGPPPGVPFIGDTEPGQSLIIKAIDGATSVRNSKLVITYEMRIDETAEPNPPCSPHTFYSWSQLDLGSSPGIACVGGGRYHNDATEVTVAAPAMTVDLSGLASLADKCGTYPITLDVRRTSTTAAPYDVRVVLENPENDMGETTDGYVIDPSTAVCTGVAPDQLYRAQCRCQWL